MYLKRKRDISRIMALIVAAALMLLLFSSCKKKTVANVSNTSGGESSVVSDSGLGDSTSVSSQSESGSQTSTAKNTSKTKISTVSRSQLSGTSAPAQRDRVSGDVVIYPVKDPVITESTRDLKGRKVLFGTYWRNEWLKDSYKVNAIKGVEKDYNCKIQFVDLSGSFEQVVQVKRAAGIIYADIFDTQGIMQTAISSGTFMDLRTLSSVNLAKNQWNKAFTLGATYKGGIYGVGIDQDMINRPCIYFNKKIAAKYNLGDFYQMVIKRQWTLDNFTKICQQVYQKSNHTVNGLNSIFNSYVESFIHSNGTSPLVIKNNKVVFNCDDSKFMYSLNWLADFSKQGLYDLKTSFSSGSNGDASKAMVGFAQGKQLFFLTDDWVRKEICTQMTDDYGILPLPTGPSAKDYISLVSNVRYFSVFNGEPDAEDMGAVITALAKRSYIPIAEWDKVAAKTLRDSESIQMMHLLMQSEPKFFTVLTGLGATNYGKSFNYIISQQKTPRQTIDEISNSVTASVNALYNGSM